MIGLPASVTDALTIGGYRLGWAAVQRMPERAAYALFDRIADLTLARGGARQLRANYARVRPELTPDALDALTREGMRAYMRYYCEAFRLPALSPQQLAERVRLVGDRPVREAIERGEAVVCFLGHMGNWDLAGAWAGVHWTHVTTVAERLKPEEVFTEFLAFREGLGMTIYAHSGAGNVFAQLKAATSAPGLIPLLADRDLTRKGIDVDLAGVPAKVAAGPAALALEQSAPLFPVSIHHERRGAGWGIVITFHDQVRPPAQGTSSERIAAMTQDCATALGAAIREHTADWHMLQKVFIADLDSARVRPTEAP